MISTNPHFSGLAAAWDSCMYEKVEGRGVEVFFKEASNALLRALK